MIRRLIRRLRWLLILAGLCASCAAVEAPVGVRGSPMPSAVLDAATAAVWRSYGRLGSPPEVLVVTGPGLSCTDPVSGRPGFPVLLSTAGELHRACREGYTLTPWMVSVAWTGQPWSSTPLAHEIRHAADLREGIVDPDHTGFAWYGDSSSTHPITDCPMPPDGCGSVAVANAALRGAGL